MLLLLLLLILASSECIMLEYILANRATNATSGILFLCLHKDKDMVLRFTPPLVLGDQVWGCTSSSFFLKDLDLVVLSKRQEFEFWGHSHLHRPVGQMHALHLVHTVYIPWVKDDFRRLSHLLIKNVYKHVVWYIVLHFHTTATTNVPIYDMKKSTYHVCVMRLIF